MIKLGFSFPERRKVIDELLESKSFEGTHKFEFQGESKYFNVYKVSIDMPKYRLANGRTIADQQEFLIRNPDKSKNFFIEDIEFIEAHKQQHEFLKKLLNDKGINLIDYFKDNKQTEPIVIDNKGFVINGNRRLCAIRELYYSDKNNYKHFSNIDIIILPPCSEKDIDELEARLQIKRDIKADYTWISEACMLREKQKRNSYTTDEIAHLYDMKISDVKEKLDILSLSEEYLLSRDMKNEYSKVIKNEFAFKRIREGRIQNSDRNIEEKDIFKNISYLIIDDPDEAEMGRAYDVIRNISKSLDPIIEELVEELPIDNYNFDVDNSEADIFETNDSDNKDIERLSLAVMDENNKENILEIVRDVIEREKTLTRDSKKANFVLSQLKKAQSCLQEALNSFNNDTITKGISEQINSIEIVIDGIRKRVNDD